MNVCSRRRLSSARAKASQPGTPIVPTPDTDRRVWIARATAWTVCRPKNCVLLRAPRSTAIRSLRTNLHPIQLRLVLPMYPSPATPLVYSHSQTEVIAAYAIRRSLASKIAQHGIPVCPSLLARRRRRVLNVALPSRPRYPAPLQSLRWIDQIRFCPARILTVPSARPPYESVSTYLTNAPRPSPARRTKNDCALVDSAIWFVDRRRTHRRSAVIHAASTAIFHDAFRIDVSNASSAPKLHRAANVSGVRRTSITKFPSLVASLYSPRFAQHNTRTHALRPAINFTSCDG